MRVGGAQDLLNLGASLPQIMLKGGWAKTDTVMRYVERVRSKTTFKMKCAIPAAQSGVNSNYDTYDFEGLGIGTVILTTAKPGQRHARI